MEASSARVDEFTPSNATKDMILAVALIFLLVLLVSIVAVFTFISVINREVGDHSRTTVEIKTSAPPVISLRERLWAGFAHTRVALATSIEALLKDKAQIDADFLENIHEILYRADVGNKVADQLVTCCREKLSGVEISIENVKSLLREEVGRILVAAGSDDYNKIDGKKKILLMVGVNGVGKTTTIGKLAHHYLNEQKRVLICAADTFRAAASDQLQVWADRLQTNLIKREPGSDPGAVLFDAIQVAKKQDTDVLLVDTAGRLHSKNDLMAELQKMRKIASKNDELFALETWIVLDATTGQNALAQVKTFLELVQISGIIVTKLDGTAKGGVIIAICEQFKIPVRFIGIGEQVGDLRQFKPQEVANSILA